MRFESVERERRISRIWPVVWSLSERRQIGFGGKSWRPSARPLLHDRPNISANSVAEFALTIAVAHANEAAKPVNAEVGVPTDSRQKTRKIRMLKWLTWPGLSRCGLSPIAILPYRNRPAIIASGICWSDMALGCDLAKRTFHGGPWGA